MLFSEYKKLKFEFPRNGNDFFNLDGSVDLCSYFHNNFNLRMKYQVFGLIYSEIFNRKCKLHNVMTIMQLRFIDQTTESNFKVSVIEQGKSDIVFF